MARAWAHRARREEPDGKEALTGRRLAVGDRVLLRKARGSGGLACKWLGPYAVTEAVPPTFGLRTADDRVTRRPFHSHRLRRYVPSESMAGAQWRKTKSGCADEWRVGAREPRKALERRVRCWSASRAFDKKIEEARENENQGER